jgi:hypothetical protein
VGKLKEWLEGLFLNYPKKLPIIFSAHPAYVKKFALMTNRPDLAKKMDSMDPNTWIEVTID